MWCDLLCCAWWWGLSPTNALASIWCAEIPRVAPACNATLTSSWPLLFNKEGCTMDEKQFLATYLDQVNGQNYADTGLENVMTKKPLGWQAKKKLPIIPRTSPILSPCLGKAKNFVKHFISITQCPRMDLNKKS